MESPGKLTGLGSVGIKDLGKNHAQAGASRITSRTANPDQEVTGMNVFLVQNKGQALAGGFLLPAW